ncbi:MAG: flavodoxin [Ruminococcaceae bacterium]|nr:flavodoxin [Oscillospiraceae bacterium]
MKTLVIYKSKYGSTKQYATWIGEELGCEVKDAKKVKIEDLEGYETIIYGGGLYAEVISGVNFITKNFDRLCTKKIVVFSTGITPIEYRDYYDKLVIEKNFKPYMLEKIKVYNFLGKMILDELSLPHKTAIKALKKLMSSKGNPTEMEKLLIDLCDANGDFTDKKSITNLINYVKNNS